jgi:hypothetical protein
MPRERFPRKRGESVLAHAPSFDDANCKKISFNCWFLNQLHLSSITIVLPLCS